MTLYRKNRGTTTWHWCRTCSQYPGRGADVETMLTATPLPSTLCKECMEIERRERYGKLWSTGRRTGDAG